jgi:hypothetical protein
MVVLRFLYRLTLRLIPVLCCWLGWRFGGWVGAVAGAAVGCGAAIIIWGAIYYQTGLVSLQRRQRAVSALATERLREIAADPTSRDLGFAIGELARRGVEAGPSLESLFDLLRSADSDRRGQGMSLLMALYPQVGSKLPLGSSNMDTVEVWRTRIAALEDAR